MEMRIDGIGYVTGSATARHSVGGYWQVVMRKAAAENGNETLQGEMMPLCITKKEANAIAIADRLNRMTIRGMCVGIDANFLGD